MKTRAPVSGSVFLVHGEATSLSVLAGDVGSVSDLGNAVVPLLGETWQLGRGHAARRTVQARDDLRARIKPRDWTAGLAALESSLGDRLRALPSDAARERAVAAITRALERSEGVRESP
jgi:metallo-beta-lactamase family protein